jgi:hypothetical protein
MRLRLLVPLLLSGLASETVSATPWQAWAQQSLDDVVVIDGQKNPELLPQWAAWEHLFRLLALVKDSETRAFTHDLESKLSADEILLLFKEADAQKTREKYCLEALQRLWKRTPAQDDTPEAIDKEAFEIELDYRRRILDARDRLRTILSVPSWIALEIWADEMVTDLKVTVPRSAFERFKQPG